jgi:hypothetical protein
MNLFVLECSQFSKAQAVSSYLGLPLLVFAQEKLPEVLRALQHWKICAEPLLKTAEITEEKNEATGDGSLQRSSRSRGCIKALSHSLPKH